MAEEVYKFGDKKSEKGRVSTKGGSSSRVSTYSTDSDDTDCYSFTSEQRNRLLRVVQRKYSAPSCVSGSRTGGRRTQGRRRKNGVDARSANSHRVDARSAAL